MAAPTEWKSFAIQIPGKDYLKEARNILETLLVYLDVVKAFLETIKAFLIDFGNPLKALIKALLDLINTLIEALKRTGIYALMDVPDPFTDPRLLRNVGGYQKFKMRFKQSLLDAQDFNRPQPIAGALKGGFVIILADANGPARLIALINTLLEFFGQEFLKPKYGPPANVKVVPVGEKGDPILAVTKVFKTQVKALAVEWSLASVTPSSDPSFQGLASELSQEFFPPKWFIERSEIPLNNEVKNTDIGSAAQAGQVVKDVETGFINPRATSKSPANTIIKRKVKVKDSNGDPFIKFQKYAIVGIVDNTATFLLGQLGTFRFIDTDVELDKTYFYRVRAYSGTLSFEDKTEGKLDKFKPSDIKTNMNDGGTAYFEWPAKDPASPVVMGRPSAIVRGKVPKLNPKFDVIEVLRHVFLSGFSFNFHQTLPPPVQVVSGGKPVKDKEGNPVYKPQFDKFGNPIAPLDVTDIGKGSLTKLAGSISSLVALPYVSLTGSVSPTAYEPNAATGKLPEMPWQTKRVRFAAARNAVKFAGVFLEVPASVVEGFRTFMQGPLPAGTPTTQGTLKTADTLEKMVYALTKTTLDQSVVGKAASAILETDVFSTQVVDEDTARTYGTAFTDPIVRKNLLAAVNYLNNLAGQGVPPNWIQLSILRDIIPWSGQLLYDLLAKIQALLDAFNGVIEELKKFIDLLIRKIDTMEKFIKFLIEILNYIESLSLGFYMLSASGLNGSVTEWFNVLDTATNEPPSGPQGYTGGICLAYLAIDVAAFETAFKAIF